MLKLIALHGPAGSGKTSVARALQARGYMHINFSDALKEMAVAALKPTGTHVTVADMNENKERYRGFLQSLGEVIGYSDDPKYVYFSLLDWFGEPAVFDNVRTPQQAETLRGVGFAIVKLECPAWVSEFRRPGCLEHMGHPAEQPLPDSLIDYRVNASLSLDLVMRQVMGL